MVQKNYLIPDGAKWQDEDIVISGISARLPNADSVEEFRDKLLDKVDLITDEPRRFQNGLYGAIKRYGLLKDLSKFDAKFFNIHPKQAERMDPQIRNLLEVAYEATVDAGLHPEDLSGTRTGVVVGVASSETQDKWSQQPERINGYEYTGCTRTMFANRVSYYMDLKGPSYSIDTASSTTLIAFQQAYDMIRDGVCDSCFVCGTDLVLNPCVCLMFQCLNMLSPEGKCKAFDIEGNGYVRSEGVVAVLLQRAKVAKRVYANVLGSGSNCDGYKDEGITFPSGQMQVKLFRKVSDIANIDPKTIDYMEAHGSATRVGDPQEMNAVTEVFTTGRNGPLRTGSIKSNMGHGEPASALSAVIKICVAMESGIIPPNLHYNTPNPDIPALLDGRLNVITEPTPWDGGLVAVNSFGVGGANGHAILLSNKKQKRITPDNFARLVCVSGVTESAVKTMLNKIESLPRDPELYALLNNIHRKNIKGHQYRGSIVFNDKETLRVQEKFSNARPIIFFFPGLESERVSMNTDLLNIPIFKEIIQKCETELKTVAKSMNLVSILSNFGNEKSPLNLSIGLVALQITLSHVFRNIQITPERAVGCNIGAISEAYFANALSIKQSILTAYHVGNVLQKYAYESAAIVTNAPAEEVNPPSGVYLTTKITPTSSIYCGPKSSIIKFQQQLTNKNYMFEIVEHAVVDVAGILKNSNYIPQLKVELSKLIINVDLVESIISGITLLSGETVSKNPVVLTIGGNGKGFPDEVPLVTIGNEQFNSTSVTEVIGQLYIYGAQPQLQNLYPIVEFPVSHGTPFIQSMIEWDHSHTWNVVSFAPQDGRTAGELDVVVDFDKAEFESLPGNKINSKELIPKGFYMYLVWKVMSRLQNKPMSEIPLVFENIYFLRDTRVPDDEPVKFSVDILQSSGKFEMWESGEIVFSGQVRIPTDTNKEVYPDNLLDLEKANVDCKLDKNSVYRTLSIKKYQYNDSFKHLNSFNFNDCKGSVKINNWSAVFEAFFQVLLLNSVVSENSFPDIYYIRKAVVDPSKCQMDDIIELQYNKKLKLVKSNCLEIRGTKLKKTLLTMPTCQSHTDASIFVPFHSKNVENAAEASLLLALQNWAGYNNLKIAELAYDSTELLLTSSIYEASPFLNTDITIFASDVSDLSSSIRLDIMKYISKNIKVGPVDSNCHIIIAKNVLGDDEAFKNLIASVRTDGCILIEENFEAQFTGYENVECVSALSSNDKTYFVLKKVHSQIRITPRITIVNNILDIIEKAPNAPDSGLIFLIKSSETSGAVQFLKSARAESTNKNLGLLLLEDESAPMFSLSDPVYTNQLKKNYPISVYKNGAWGTYLSVSLPEKLFKNVEDSFLRINYEGDGNFISAIQANSHIYKQKYQSPHVNCVVSAAAMDRFKNGVHFNDVPAYSSPTLEQQNEQLGTEFSGYDGNRKVFGLVAGGALATSVVADKYLLWPVPENWSFEEAATVPHSYTMSYYVLSHRVKIQKGSTILIIGTQNLALAAIYVALSQNCDIFMLLSSEEEKPLLRKLYPQINEANMIVSKNNDFYLQVLQRTYGKGVNVVYNTISNNKFKFQSYINSLADNGSFVYFNNQNSSEEILGSSGNLRCITFHRVSPNYLFENDNVGLRQKIGQLVSEGLKNGTVHPLPYSTLKFCDIQRAFSTTTLENVCKTIVSFGSKSSVNAEARTYLSTEKSYIFAVDNEFSIYVSAWLMNQGAKKVVLVKPVCENEGNWEKLLALMTEIMSVEQYQLVSCSASEKPETIVEMANKLAPLGGIFDLTQIHVEEIDNLSSVSKKFLDTALSTKVNFVISLDNATRKSKLDYFVSFSSVELDFGLNKFSVHSYVNGALQTVMRKRNQSGLNGTLIQWGKVGESMNQILYNDFNTDSNIATQSISSCLQTLHKLLQVNEPVVSSFVASKQGGGAGDSKVDVIMEGVGKYLGIKDLATVVPTLTMLELGLDSLICTDIQQFLEINYGVALNTQEVRDLTFDKLKILAESL